MKKHKTHINILLVAIILSFLYSGCSPKEWGGTIPLWKFDCEDISGTYSNSSKYKSALDSNIDRKHSLSSMLGHDNFPSAFFTISFIDKNTFKIYFSYSDPKSIYKVLKFVRGKDYSCWGGKIKIGGKCEFLLDSHDEDCDTIYLYAGKDGALIVKFRPMFESQTQWAYFSRTDD